MANKLNKVGDYEEVNVRLKTINSLSSSLSSLGLSIMDFRDYLTDIIENDEDIKDYDSAVKTTTKITRKILTGNSTYLFYDKERKLKGPGRYTQRLDSLSSNRRSSNETQNSRNADGLNDVDLIITINSRMKMMTLVISLQ